MGSTGLSPESKGTEVAKLRRGFCPRGELRVGTGDEENGVKRETRLFLNERRDSMFVR